MFRSVICICLIFPINSLCFSMINGLNHGHIGNNTLSKTVSRPSRHVNSTKTWHGSWKRSGEGIISEHPFMVSVHVNSMAMSFKKHCSGAYYVKPYYILTAAHCVHSGTAVVAVDAVTIRYNTRRSDRGGITSDVLQIKIHPSYDYSRHAYDIAVLKTTSQIKGDKVDSTTLAALPAVDRMDLKAKENDDCDVVGFGINNDQDPILKKIKIQLIPISECQEMLRLDNVNVNEYENLCVYRFGTNVCEGDGGQVIFCYMIYGIVGVFSYGKNCGSRNRPAVFTKLNSISDSFLRTASQGSRGAKSDSYSVHLRLELICGVLFLLGIRMLK